ncbi:MAG: sensor histidine kinase, partial [Oscillospiraceae bacterium]|nr:sensor histidine kinase [Oscillospiraceae bacterium]
CYVDLLKKEELDSPAAQEYVQVLERKSQQLKKLTEDLIEASKASTGAVTVSRERLDLAQLARQAVGEYEPRLKQAGLAAVVNVPEQPLPISADGRHMGRVLDNLLGNCVKYALAGTRVYVDVLQQEDRAVLTVKNVSRQPLNVPPEQLLERFVRGDESRTTEGSGLGLSIARSLTELQQGRFSLSIDGDLFKVSMDFPVLQEE